MVARKRSAKPVEWIGGVVSLPAYVTGEGEPYRPEAVFWVVAEGLVLGMQVPGRSAAPAQIVKSFHDTTRAPMVGGPHVPDLVRVASPELATVLRSALGPQVEVVCAPTPELDAILSSMRESMGAADVEDDDEEDTYLGPGITADATASFFRTAARLYRAAPWKAVPGDAYLIGVDVAASAVHGAVISVIGQLGESFGFVLFGSYADYEAYVEAAGEAEAGQMPRLPRHVALNFDAGAEVSRPRRKEISAHGWEVAGARAYPWVVIVDEDIVARPPTPAELTVVEAIAGALAALVEGEPQLRKAFEGSPVLRTIAVTTGAGPVEVTLTAPHDAAAGRAPPKTRRGAPRRTRGRSR
jgi:hypothetical protein